MGLRRHSSSSSSESIVTKSTDSSSRRSSSRRKNEVKPFCVEFASQEYASGGSLKPCPFPGCKEFLVVKCPVDPLTGRIKLLDDDGNRQWKGHDACRLTNHFRAPLNGHGREGVQMLARRFPVVAAVDLKGCTKVTDKGLTALGSLTMSSRAAPPTCGSTDLNAHALCFSQTGHAPLSAARRFVRSTQNIGSYSRAAKRQTH